MTDNTMDHTMEQSKMMGTASNPSSNVKVAAGYVLTERLGSGSFATVYKGVMLAEYQEAINRGSLSPPLSDSIGVVAIKAISRSSKKLTKKVLENLDMEIAILRTYRHPNIVCLHQVQKTDRHFYLVLEYCGGGDLQRLIRTRQNGRLSERLCRRLVRDLAAGLGFLWGKELVHRDIKPQNLLLTGPLPSEEETENPPREDAKRALRGMSGERFMLKIADFGFARHLSGVDLAETMCGSPLYMAPEILSGQKYDAKADLWSVGAVLFEMIAGVTPFHGENHMDLLRNIKTKAVRLPANVRISREFVHLLKLLLDRKPHNRAGFNAFFEACEALVALGCNGAPGVTSTSVQKSSNLERMPSLHTFFDDRKVVDRDVCVQMNLCAISENDGTGESCHQGADQNSSIASTFGTINHQQLQVRQLNAGANYVPNMATTHNTMNAMVQARHDYMNKPGVVTPPLNPLSAPHPPPTLPYGLQGAGRQYYGNRPSIFAPLRGSPNLSPSVTPATAAVPPLFLLGGTPTDNNTIPVPGTIQTARPVQYQVMNQSDGHFPTVVDQAVMNRVANIRNSSPKVSIHEDQYSDSGFVMVEYSGCRSKAGSGRISPSNSTRDTGHPLSSSPHNFSGRVTILDAKNNMGMLSTSPGTGRALFGKMMMGSPSLTPPSASGVGRFDLSPRTALRSGGCLAHIDVLVRMLAASEDIGRRAITVAHLGDVRAYLGMGLLVTLREESQLSSISTGTPMEGVDEETSTDTPVINDAKRLSSEKLAADDDEEEEEMPFAMTTSSGSNENMSGSNIVKSSENEKKRDEVTSSMIQMYFREALKCYFKALAMMKGSICAAQQVMKEFEDVLLAGNLSPSDKNPYTPLKNRCSSSLEWLKGQFSAVLERADAANDQISRLQKSDPTRTERDGETSILVEELIYNHSLKCGREGAVKQILGHYDEARSCFRSAGLLAETLLMESKVGEEDRVVLEGYVNSFADQIITLDGLIRVEMRKSRALVEQSQVGGENKGT